MFDLEREEPTRVIAPPGVLVEVDEHALADAELIRLPHAHLHPQPAEGRPNLGEHRGGARIPLGAVDVVSKAAVRSRGT